MAAPKPGTNPTATAARSNGSARSRQGANAISQAANPSSSGQRMLSAQNLENYSQQSLFERIKDPMDFESLPLSALRKYRIKNKLAIRSPLSLNGYMLDSPIGKKTLSYKNRTRAPKYEIAAQVKKHFLSQPVRETETIVDFIYAVKKQGEWKSSS